MTAQELLVKFPSVCLAAALFVPEVTDIDSISDAIEKIEVWRIDYNTTRPHSSIGSRTPAAFAAASVLAMQQGETLCYPWGFAPRPVATTTQTGSNIEQTLPSTG